MDNNPLAALAPPRKRRKRTHLEIVEGDEIDADFLTQVEVPSTRPGRRPRFVDVPIAPPPPTPAAVERSASRLPSVSQPVTWGPSVSRADSPGLQAFDDGDWGGVYGDDPDDDPLAGSENKACQPAVH